MMRRLAMLVALGLCACGGEGRRGLRVGGEQPQAGAAGPSAGGGGFGNAGTDQRPVDSSQHTLEVDVQDGEGLRIDIVTVQCDGECADVVAVASGGNPPYEYAWEDGSEQAERRVCPSETTVYEVSARDTAIDVAEFERPAMSATAEVTARVLDCPDDGGVPTAGGELCLENPSFEGRPALNEDSSTFDGGRWDACTGPGRITLTASIWSEDVTAAAQEIPSPAPADGSSYARLVACNAPNCFQPFLGEGTDLVAQELCEPMKAGVPYSFEIDIASPDAIGGSWGNTRAALAVYAGPGAPSSCPQRELLWTSPVATPSWQTHCVTITPSEDSASLTLGVANPDGLHFVYVDNILPVDACP